jgi:hypothetical protein
MKEKIKKTLKIIQNVIEELWMVVVILWNLPVGIIELIWNALFNKEKFAYNWALLKDAIRRK